MFQVLLQAINEKVTLSEDEQQLCTSFFTPRSLRKKQCLLQENDICRHIAFVEKGILRSYTLNSKGGEHIMQFALQGWWITDMYSFLTEEPSLMNIEVLEDADVLLLTKEAHENLVQQVPKMERFFRILAQNAMVALQRRIMGNMTLSAEEKYLKLQQTFPGIMQMVPQHMIASYLGITAETLSRIRKQISLRK